MKLADLSAGNAIVFEEPPTCATRGPHIISAAPPETPDPHVRKGDRSKPAKPGALFILCRQGRHYLDAYEGGDGELVGIKQFFGPWERVAK